MGTIVVKWVRCGGIYAYEMRVVESSHKRFSVGTRFDFGFFEIATREGYTIISIPCDDRNNRDKTDGGNR